MVSPPPVTSLIARGLSVSYGAQPALSEVSLSLSTGGITALVGPNGSGKSTLLRVLAGVLRPAAGSCQLGGRELHTLPRRELARLLAYLPQSTEVPTSLTCREVVSQGRFAHVGLWQPFSQADHQAVEQALAATGAAEFAERPLDHLSGGERQRVWLARALAQQSSLLLLDEPLSALDLYQQLTMLERLRSLAERGVGVLVSLHDLSQAATWADEVLVLDRGRLVGQGAPQEVLNPELLASVFKVRAKLLQTPGGSTLLEIHGPLSEMERSGG